MLDEQLGSFKEKTIMIKKRKKKIQICTIQNCLKELKKYSFL